MKTKLRNLISLFAYLVRYRQINLLAFVVDTIILVLSIMQWDSVAQADSLLGLLALIFVNYIWQALNIFNHFRKFFAASDYSDLQTILDQDKIRVDENEWKNYQYLSNDLNMYIINPKFNEVLRGDMAIPLTKKNKKAKRVKAYISQNFHLLYPFMNFTWNNAWEKGAFYNETKLCLASDWDAEEGVFVCKGYYYDNFLTNVIYNKKLLNNSGEKLVPCMNAEIKPVSGFLDSCFCDQIGVSTIAITKDGYGIILCQNKQAQINRLMLTASGSGSVDYKDYHDGDTLQQTILRAAERELCEETDSKGVLMRNSIVNSHITGFYRDLTRGGKPEFCCVTYLNKTKKGIYDILNPNPNEQTQIVHFLPIITDHTLNEQLLEDLNSYEQQSSCTLRAALFNILEMLRNNGDGGMDSIIVPGM